MKTVIAILLMASLLLLVGCSGNAGGSVDVGAVQKQADKEKEINNKATKDKPLPPGDGPSN